MVDIGSKCKAYFGRFSGSIEVQHVKAGDEARNNGERRFEADRAFNIILLLRSSRNLLPGLSSTSQRPDHLASVRYWGSFIVRKLWRAQDDTLGSLARARTVSPSSDCSRVRSADRIIVPGLVPAAR